MDDALLARLRSTFIVELQEQVALLNRALLSLEEDTDAVESVRTVFRAAHTIKGAARVAAMPLIEQVCHSLESVFAEVRDGRRTLSGSDFSLIFAAVDALADAGARLRDGAVVDEGMLETMATRLQQLTGEELPAADDASVRLTSPIPPPAPAPAPVPEPETAAAPAPPVEPSAPEGPAGTADDHVRVRTERLDELLAAAGELLVVSGRFIEREGRANDEARRLELVVDRIVNGVRHLRLRPLADACEALPRAVRDLAAGSEREIRLELEGMEVEADRFVIDTLREPLLHLVRNAADHGIEPADERERLGKPRTGTIRVTAEIAGGRLIVSVADDGAGLDEERIREVLRERGQPSPQSSAELADALIRGGFSTREHATAISGRGVGVDVVRSALERIGGSVDIEWGQGTGTRFILECPPAPSSLRALLVRVGESVFAIPSAHVERLRRVRQHELHNAEGTSVLTTPEGPVTVVQLATVLGPPLDARPLEGAGTLVIVGAGARRAGLIVDEAIDEDEIVVRPLEVDSDAVPYAAGAAILPSGRVALVLSTTALLTGVTRRGVGNPVFAPPASKARLRVLVADDSITTRTMEQGVLEAAGYDVITAVDGEDAWRRLELEAVDAVVADVEMPRMDGMGLTRRIRASGTFSKLPVVLVTGLSSAEDQARGLEAGADAYIVKSNFDQATLLDTLNQLIGE